jgi:adenine-specific DNA-methyltransferase
MLLGRCEFGEEDYSLNIVNLPEPTPDPSQEGNLNKNPSKEGNKMGISQEGKCGSPLLGGDLGVGKSDKGKKPEKDTISKSHNKQRKLFE